MEKILLFRSKYSDSLKDGILLGFSSNNLYRLSIRKKVDDGKIHYELLKSQKSCEVKPGEKFIDALFNEGGLLSNDNFTKSDYNILELKIIPGGYNPRIYRPLFEERDAFDFGNQRMIEEIKQIVLGNNRNHFPYDTTTLISGLSQLMILTNMLDAILNTIIPSPENLQVYGYNIKNLLVLACIEVEAQLIGILQLNELVSKNRCNTSDYIKLKAPLHLHEYSTKLVLYPNLMPLSPFESWTEDFPTKSLTWYDNYNAVKHNSELNINKATLESAISAVCAVSILLRAQYGPNIPILDHKVGVFYDIRNRIRWSEDEYLLPPLKGENWTITPYGF